MVQLESYFSILPLPLLTYTTTPPHQQNKKKGPEMLKLAILILDAVSLILWTKANNAALVLAVVCKYCH